MTNREPGIIATILNGGTCPKTGKTLLRSHTVDAMFENQIPQWPNFARKEWPAAMPDGTYPIKELYPQQPHDQPQGWGLSFMLTLAATLEGRGPKTGSWSGKANCQWWADYKNGVGCFLGCQIIPYAGESTLELRYLCHTKLIARSCCVGSTQRYRDSCLFESRILMMFGTKLERRKLRLSGPTFC